MPDHFHLLLVPAPPTTLSQVMQVIKGRWARRWNKGREEKGQVWQPRYYERTARTEDQILSRVRYIDENPVKAGLAPSSEVYAFGSASRTQMGDLQEYLGGRWGDRWLGKRAGAQG